jgi:hypothetical protein
MPVEFAIICTISQLCNAYVWAAMALHWVETPWLKEPVARLIWGVMMGVPVILGGIMVDCLAYHVFANVPLFNPSKRPTYTLRQRVSYHADFLKHTAVLGIALSYVDHPGTFKPVDAVTSWSDFRPFAGDSPFDSIKAFARFYLVTACAVQSGLVLCDIFYWSSHIVQHKFKTFYEWSNHEYHHYFRFPLSGCGPWLGLADLAISNLTTFILPASLTLHVMEHFKVFDHLPGHVHGQQVSFYRVLIFAYIHWLNHHDHCGKQMPLWSGAPLCPPLGWAFGLDQCIPNHESHHNFHSCGYGLLSVADRIFGTNGYPASDPRFLVRAAHMGKAAMATLKLQNSRENVDPNAKKIE